MNKLLLTFLINVMLFVIHTNVFAYDSCNMENFGGLCVFDTFDTHPEAEVYFHCETDYSITVKMISHNILVSGFLSGDDIGSGTYSYTGTNTQKFFRTYYFAVRNDPKRSRGPKYLYIYSAGSVHCEIGKGGRSKVLPGLFGYLT